MAFTPVLAQALGTVAAATIYTLPANKRAIFRNMIVANTTALASTFDIFVDDAAAGFGAGTAIANNVAIPANTTVFIGPDDLMLPLVTTGGLIGVGCAVLNDCTFTMSVIEEDV